ncbi:MAG: thiamine diphosphokinase [Rhodobacter sp.]|nr:thiamine diphosphokinase [Rhodobacter sp.]
MIKVPDVSGSVASDVGDSKSDTTPKTLVGGAPFTAVALHEALAFAPRIVAVDGGANRLRQLDITPDLVIGDMDSISDQIKAWVGSSRLVQDSDTDTTDFEKAIASVQAPFLLAVGFTGGRMDHSLAVINTLARNFNKRILLLSGRDVIFLSPRTIQMELPAGTRISFFPMGDVRGASHGLRWELDHVPFSPTGKISTSNQTTGSLVSLSFDADKMIVILPRRHLDKALIGIRARDEHGR